MTIAEFKIEILKQEIDLVNQKINHFDNLRHGTKQMAITLWLAAMGVGLTAKIEGVILLAAFVPLPFWFFESIYHAYQEGFAARLWAIRNFIRTGQFTSLEGGHVELVECMKHTDFGEFPVPDYYGNFTLASDVHKKKTSVVRNFIKIKMVLSSTIYRGIAIVLNCLRKLIEAHHENDSKCPFCSKREEAQSFAKDGICFCAEKAKEVSSQWAVKF